MVDLPDPKPVIHLPEIRLADLEAASAGEQARLLQACREYGFFTLDLNCSRDEDLYACYRSVLDFMDGYFCRPLADKLLDDRGSDMHGYEPVGTSAGVYRGSKDGYESLKIARQEILHLPEALPPRVQTHLPLFGKTMAHMHSICVQTLESLSLALGFKDRDTLRKHHSEAAPSTTNMSMFRYPGRVDNETQHGHNHHTDLGSLTILYAAQWGLQVRPPRTDEWHFVAPAADRVIVNVGDSLRFLSEQQLRSCVHRVIPIPQRHGDRFSIAYFLRASDGVTYTDTKGRRLTARQWHDEKFEHFRDTHERQDGDSILLGGMGGTCGTRIEAPLRATA